MHQENNYDIADVNCMMHQGDNCVHKKIVYNNFTPSGCGRAHAIMIATSHDACNCKPTVRQT
jgi:hypothetical protein